MQNLMKIQSKWRLIELLIMHHIAIASLNRKSVISSREMALAHPRKNELQYLC